MTDIEKIVLKKLVKKPVKPKTGKYPVLDMGRYFAGGGLFGYASGLYYDFATQTEKNYTVGECRMNGNKVIYEDLRKQIETLPEMKDFELRAFRMTTYDDVGTIISFAIAHRGSHSLLRMSPFCGASLKDKHFYSKNPSDLVKCLVNQGVSFADGKKIALGDYIFRGYG